MNKIAFFLPSLKFGGIEANTIRLATSLRRSGYEVEIVVGNLEGEYIKRLNDEITIVNLNKKKLIRMVIPLIKYMKSNNSLVLISGGEGANIVASLAKKIYPKHKVVISIRTNLSQEYNETENKKKKLLYPILTKSLYKNVDGIVAVSNGVAENASSLLGIPSKKINVIYNPIIDDSFSQLMNEEIYHKWLENKKYKVIVSVGRLTKQKDLLTLVKAFGIAREQMNLKLIIIGDGPEYSKLINEIHKKGLEEHVDMVGFIQNPYPYMKKADLFVLSSKWEGFGNVIVEALATGVKVVSTDCPSGPSEILSNGVYGRLVEVESSVDLANAILETISLDDNTMTIRQERANVFSVEAAKKKYLEIIDNIT